MADEPSNTPFERPIEVERLRANAAFTFDEAPTEPEAEAVRAFLGLRGLRKLRFAGEIVPLDKKGWVVKGQLGASLTQSCIVSLEAVKTRLDIEVSLRFLPESMVEYDTPEDVLEDDVEVLTSIIDLGQVAVEALMLAMPEYPRTADSELIQTTAAPPGIAPMKDEETKPFAGLEALKSKLNKDS